MIIVDAGKYVPLQEQQWGRSVSRNTPERRESDLETNLLRKTAASPFLRLLPVKLALGKCALQEQDKVSRLIHQVE